MHIRIPNDVTSVAHTERRGDVTSSFIKFILNKFYAFYIYSVYTKYFKQPLPLLRLIIKYKYNHVLVHTDSFYL